MIAPLDTILLIFALVCGIAALKVEKLLSAVIIFGAFSFFSALLFLLLDALDVAFTEAAVGAGITTVFFVAALHVTRERPHT